MIDTAQDDTGSLGFRMVEMRSAWGGTTLPPVQWVDDAGGLRVAPADPATALQVAAFLACVRVLSESVAQLPCHLYRVNADGTKEKAVDHPLYALLHDRPNPWQSSYEFRETLVAHTATWGNGFARKVYRSGVVAELWPMHPSQVTVTRLANNALRYVYAEPGIAPAEMMDDEVCHFRWLSDNGYLGMVPLSLSAGVVGLARSMDRYAQKFWANDARPGIVMESNQPIPKEAAETLRMNWERMHRGVENAGRTAILPNGVTIKELSGASNESAQLIEMRVFLVQEIARAMRVPCSMIGENSRSTFSNAEQEQLSFLQNTLVSWCRRIESALERSLLGDMPGYSIGLDVRGMLRGDSAARSSYYSALAGLGVLSPNDIRRLEDMPPIAGPGADSYFLPANNLAPLEKLADEDEKSDPAAAGSVLSILQAVSAGTITAKAAEALILATFPDLDPMLVLAMVEGAEPAAEEAAETPAEESAEGEGEMVAAVEAEDQAEDQAEGESEGETDGN